MGAISIVTYAIGLLPYQLNQALISHLWICTSIFSGMVSNYDYFLKKTKNENWWPSLPYQKYKYVFLPLFLVIVGVWLHTSIFPFVKMAVKFSTLSQRHSVSDGTPIRFNDFNVTPPVGWDVYADWPTENEAKIALYQKNVSSLQVTVFSPKKNKPFASLESPVVKYVAMEEMKKKVRRGVSHIPVNPIQISGQKWIKANGKTRRPINNQVLFHYTLKNGKLITFRYETIEQFDQAEEVVEKIAASLN
jgi:hypothetical protein